MISAGMDDEVRPTLGSVPNMAVYGVRLSEADTGWILIVPLREAITALFKLITLVV